MQNIRVERYNPPISGFWAGNIQPEDGSWIMFIDVNGHPFVYLNRDPNGGVLSDDPVRREEQLKERGFTK